MKNLFGKIGALFALGATGTPTNPHQAPFDQAEPEGLRLVHVTATPAEADLLRQVLADAGFHLEHVAAASTGVFGTSGSTSVYVRADEYDEAVAFVQE